MSKVLLNLESQHMKERCFEEPYYSGIYRIIIEKFKEKEKNINDLFLMRERGKEKLKLFAFCSLRV